MSCEEIVMLLRVFNCTTPNPFLFQAYREKEKEMDVRDRSRKNERAHLTLVPFTHWTVDYPQCFGVAFASSEPPL